MKRFDRLMKTPRTAVRASWPERAPLFVRISATDWIDGGWDIRQSVELARQLKELGADLIDCSSGGNVPHAKIPVGPGYQTPFAEQIRRETNILTGAVGMITSPVQQLRRDAHEGLKIGTTREEVLRFISENRLQARSDQSKAWGWVVLSRGCGRGRDCSIGPDGGMISVEVKIDERGKVNSEPVVIERYVGDCM